MRILRVLIVITCCCGALGWALKGATFSPLPQADESLVLEFERTPVVAVKPPDGQLAHVVVPLPVELTPATEVTAHRRSVAAPRAARTISFGRSCSPPYGRKAPAVKDPACYSACPGRPACFPNGEGK
jgi:hypothetical protein